MGEAVQLIPHRIQISMEITKEKFLEYNSILERESKRGLKDWMTKVIVNLSNGKLSYQEVKEITKNYLEYEKQFR